MIFKETPWERRNLGVGSSAVFQFDENDAADAARDAVDNRGFEYQEAVVPMGRVDLLNALLAGGFRFCEVAIRQTMKPECTLPPVYARRLGAFSCHPADAAELARVYEAMENGHIFQTDKIALNPRYGPAAAARRYRYWVEDEIASGQALPFAFCHKGEMVGFFVLKRTEKDSVTGLLAALFDTAKSAGLGVYLGYHVIEAARGMGAKSVRAAISSNNVAVLKMNEMLGYRVEAMHYVVSRHSGPSGHQEEGGAPWAGM